MWASGPRSAVLVAQILLATSVVGRRFHGLSRIINRAAVDPAPISFSPSQNWYGFIRSNLEAEDPRPNHCV